MQTGSRASTSVRSCRQCARLYHFSYSGLSVRVALGTSWLVESTYSCFQYRRTGHAGDERRFHNTPVSLRCDLKAPALGACDDFGELRKTAHFLSAVTVLAQKLVDRHAFYLSSFGVSFLNPSAKPTPPTSAPK